MTLTSISFFIFVLAVVIVYYIVPGKSRWLVLLAASLAFYAIVCLKYMPFILFTAASTWAGAIWMDRYSKKRQTILKVYKSEWSSEYKKKFKNRTTVNKRLILALVLVVNFGILAALKYYNFLAGWLGGLIGSELPTISLLLPLGISFYTFQSMGYIIDVYWEKANPQKNILKFLLFVSFFPQIVQGPIAIYGDLAHQLYKGHKLKYTNIKYGFELFVWGLFKKMVIADRLVLAVNAILPVKNDLSNKYSLLVLLVYAAQLYMDFSGGIDIIRGVAQMLGINMAENFKRPFFAISVADFWRRWHISLGNWLKNYLFYPIAISKLFLRFGRWIGHFSKNNSDLPEDSLWGGHTFIEHLGRVLPGCIATLITFFVVGMWHGANWRYAGFGIWNGIVIFLGMLLDPVFKYYLKKLRIKTETIGWRLWQIIRTFVLVMVGFVFDLGYDFSNSISMIKAVFTPQLGPSPHLDIVPDLSLTSADWIVAIIGILIVFAVSLYQENTKKSVRESLSIQPLWIQWVLLLGCLMAVVIFGMYGEGVTAAEFVYMQF